MMTKGEGNAPFVIPRAAEWSDLRFHFTVLWLVWEGKGGVLIEKVDRANQEIVPERRHDRPIFQADNMVEAQCVPTDNIGVLDGTIRLGPFG